MSETERPSQKVALALRELHVRLRPVKLDGMGLHNPSDWRYHQGPGNLFNTYLGKTQPPERPGTKRSRRDRHPPVRLSPPKERTPAEELVAFLQYNVSVGHANQFLRRVAESKGLVSEPAKSPWSEIEKFAQAHLADDDVERYLTELRRRKAAGEPLVRTTRSR